MTAHNLLDGTNWLCIHGAGMSRRLFMPLLHRLHSQRARTFVPDLPGHCRCQAEPLTTVPALAHAVAAQVESQNVGQPLFCLGHSLGGLIALELAHQRPNLFSGLVLLGVGVGIPVDASLLDSLDRSTTMWRRILVERGLSPSVSRVVVDQVVSMAAGCSLAALRADFTAYFGYDARPASATIQQPVWVLTGEDDQLVPSRHAEAMVRQLRQATHQTIDNAGHFLPLERPGAVFTALCEVSAGSV